MSGYPSRSKYDNSAEELGRRIAGVTSQSSAVPPVISYSAKAAFTSVLLVVVVFQSFTPKPFVPIKEVQQAGGVPPSKPSVHGKAVIVTQVVWNSRSSP